MASTSASLNERIKAWGRELGFQAVGIADADLSAAEPRLLEWLARGWHGEMEYMARHGALRAR
ncbi:MAG TPA: tRNA epoxyqueuosine(34) reductase QueG, partial [Burkholderiales bacterium]|nr:tRNA epoxyqueuosine(34) reductase QueG [Burkholderiales bacterium]